MATDQNAVNPLPPHQQQIEQEAPTFGGLLANPQAVEEDGFTVSLEEEDDQTTSPEEEAGLVSIVPDTTAESRPALQEKKAEERAGKAHFALGEDSPGMESILHAIREGTEDSLRQRLADAQNLKDRETRLQIIKEKAASGQNVTPEDVAFMTAITGYEPKNDPETILERRYATTVINSLSFLGPDPERSPIATAYRTNPEQLVQQQSVAEELIARQEIVKNVIADIEEVYKDTSWSGWAWDTAKTIFPLYSALKLGWGQEKSDSWLKGSVIQDMVNEYWSMPLEKMSVELRKDLAALAKDNVVLARELAHAVLSHTSNQQFLDNAFTVLDAATFPGVGTAMRGARTGAELLANKAARTPLDFSKEAATTLPKAAGEAVEATQTLKDAVTANARPDTNVARQLNDMGDVQRAAEVRVMGKARDILDTGVHTPSVKGLAEEIPSLLRADAVVENLAPNLALNMGRRLTERLQRNSERIQDALTNLVKVGRLPEEALQAAIRNEAKRLQDDFTGPTDAILDITWVRPDATDANVGVVRMHFGKEDGNVFASAQEAKAYVRSHYGLEPMEFTIHRQGNGFVAAVTRTLDETDPLVRATINTPDNMVKPSLANTFLGWLRAGNDRVSQLQEGNRLVVVHGRSALEKAFQESIDAVGRMTKTDAEELASVMRKNRTEPDSRWTHPDKEPPTGNFYHTAQEFAESFHELHGKFPTEQQTLAYFTYKQLNDWDWVMRNLGVYRDKARQGTRSIKLKMTEQREDGFRKDVSETFDGRELKAIPWNAKEDAGIVVHRDGQKHEYYRLLAANSNGDQKKALEQLLKDGYKLIQVDNPTRIPGEGRLGDEVVNFIITKDVEVRNLDFKQIPYRPGWHVEYPQEWFVKQPKIKVKGDENTPRHVYEGDQAVFGFNTRAEADKYAANMEKGRQLLIKGDDAALEAFLKDNLPWGLKPFKKLFEPRVNDKGDELPPLLDRNAPFLRTYTGNTTTDEHKKLLSSSFVNFEDTVRSQWNRFQNVDKKFLGQRDDPLWTVAEKGSELDPVLRLGNAEPIDPALAVSKAMANIIRSRHFSDYKISHVEAWVQQFGHLLDVDPADLAANPVFHLHNPTWRRSDPGNTAEMAVAANSRRALLELVGTHSEVTISLDWLRHQMLSSVYGKFGQSATDRVSNSFLYKADKDPISLMRKTAFHVNIGLFNPYQLVQNAATMVNAIAIAGPRNGMLGAVASLPMRYVLHNELMLDKMSRIASGFGWKPEHFKEAYQELKRTGKWIVEGEHTWKTTIEDPPIVASSMGGNVLDAGLTFFREGERLTRLTSWNAAYVEWRRVNPTARIDDTVRRELMVRSDLMAANMTRASNASWQQGLFSVPAQFLSYHTRLAEQMLGKRLTKAEKARLIALNSLVYGVPIGALGSSGAGAFLGGQFSLHDEVRKQFLERSIPMDSPMMVAFHGGMTNLLAHIITGNDQDLASKIGPSGGQLFKNLIAEDKTFLEILFGASGSKTVSIWRSLDPGLKAIMSPFRADESEFPVRVEDAVDLLRNVKSVDHLVNVFYAINLGKAVTKKGQLQDEVSPTEAIFNALTGGQPRRLTDAHLMQAMNIDRAKLLKEVMKDAQRDAVAMFKAYSDGDKTTGDLYAQRIRTRMIAADVPLKERARILQQAVTANTESVDRIWRDFNTKMAPDSKQQERFQNMIDQDTKKRNAQ